MKRIQKSLFLLLKAIFQVCPDNRCYTLEAEYCKINRDVDLFNNYGPVKMVTRPHYKKNLLLNYLSENNPLPAEDVFNLWYGPVTGLNLQTPSTLTLPSCTSTSCKLQSSLFYPISDNFDQFSRDCMYVVRPLGFTAKFASSFTFTSREVLTVGEDYNYCYIFCQHCVVSQNIYNMTNKR